MIIQVGARAPSMAVPDEPRALVFYKVTCSVTEMAGQALGRLGRAYDGAVVGIGQDPQEALDGFAERHSWTFPQVSDLAPYEVSDAYGIASAPTVVVVDGEGRVADVVESWDREGLNRASATLAGLLGAEPVVLSTEADGLPAFKPG